jgi:RNA-directed DNA polymerase
MRAEIKAHRIHRKSQHSLQDTAKELNPIISGWFNYYDKYTTSDLERFRDYLNHMLVARTMCKYKKLRGHKTKANLFISKIIESSPNLFVHWRKETMISVA